MKNYLYPIWCPKCAKVGKCYEISIIPKCFTENQAEQTEPQTEVNDLYDQIVEDIDTRVKCANAKKVEDEPQTIVIVKDHGRKQVLEMINLYHKLKTERTEREGE